MKLFEKTQKKYLRLGEELKHGSKSILYKSKKKNKLDSIKIQSFFSGKAMFKGMKGPTTQSSSQ